MAGKPAARQAKEQNTGKKPRGKSPEPPQQGPRDQDPYNFTDPESRIMKVRGGFEQSDNVQVAVEVATILIVGQHVTHQANYKQPLVPTSGGDPESLFKIIRTQRTSPNRR